MTKGEQVELAIYRYVEASGKGQGRTVDLQQLTELVVGIDNVDVVDALRRLADRSHVALEKFMNGPRPVPYSVFQKGPMDTSDFFYKGGGFKVTVTPHGRVDFERREAVAAAAKPVAGLQNTKETRKVQVSFRTAFAVYKDAGIIGQGGAGVVHRVIDEDGQPCALKLLRPEGASGDRLKRFKNELNFCAQVRHPNVIHAIDWGVLERDGAALPFLVMPFFPTTLAKMMADGIPAENILLWFRKIVDGIQAAHALRVCHRDLKPKNILCDADKGELVVADFGIAEFVEPLLHTVVDTSTGERLANFDYAAPEQHRPGPVDHKADIWALGLILNEMFTGQLPLGRGHKSIGLVAPPYAYLDALVERMLQQDPDARPDIGAVREVVGGEAMVSGTPHSLSGFETVASSIKRALAARQEAEDASRKTSQHQVRLKEAARSAGPKAFDTLAALLRAGGEALNAEKLPGVPPLQYLPLDHRLDAGKFAIELHPRDDRENYVVDVLVGLHPNAHQFLVDLPDIRTQESRFVALMDEQGVAWLDDQGVRATPGEIINGALEALGALLISDMQPE